MRKTLTLLAAGLLELTTGNSSQAAPFVIIDTFAKDQLVPTVVGSPTGLKSASDSIFSGGSIGGVRDITITRTSANRGSVSGDVNLSVPRTFALATGPQTVGTAAVVWDATPGAGSINFTGLGGVDLTSGGFNTQFSGASTSDLGATLTILVWTDAGNGSSASITVPADPSFTLAPFIIDFSSLTPFVGGGADLTNVGAIELFIDGTAHPATDVLVGLLQADANLPEPSSVILFGLGVAGVLGYGWQARRRKP